MKSMFSALSQMHRTCTNFTGTTPLLVSQLIYFFAQQTPETPFPFLTESLSLSFLSLQQSDLYPWMGVR